MENTTPSTGNVTPPATSPAPRPSVPARRMILEGSVTLALVAVLILAAIALARRPPQPGAEASADGRPERTEQAAGVAPVGATPQVITAAVADTPGTALQAAILPSKAPAASKTAKDRIGRSPASAARIGAATRAAEAPDKEDAAAVPAAAEPITAEPAPASTSTVSVEPPPVTITGCLEISVNADEFRLTDTEGFDAPKSRSWRTAFLKKRSAPVLLIDQPNSQALQTQVGKRVAATGLLSSHEMRVSSLRVVAPSCD